MKKINITGERQSGKTTLLVQSIIYHLTDDTLPDDTTILICAPGFYHMKALEKLVDSKLPFESVLRRGNREIIMKSGKKAMFIYDSPNVVRGTVPNYIFIDNGDLMSDQFKDTINSMRGFSVVIETSTTIDQ